MQSLLGIGIGIPMWPFRQPGGAIPVPTSGDRIELEIGLTFVLMESSGYVLLE